MKKRVIFGMVLTLLMVLHCGAPPRDRALSIIREAANDESAVVRISAARAAIENGDRTQFSVLSEFLKGTDKDAIVATLGALRDMGEITAVPLVIRFCSDKDPLVRAEALGLMSAVEHEQSWALLVAATKDRVAKIRRIAYAGLERYRDVRVLNNGLHDRDPLVRIAAARALGKIGEKGYGDFIRHELERNKTVDTWAAGCLALAELGDTAVIPFLKELLVDTPSDLKLAALEALFILHRTEEAELLKQAIRSPDPFVRVKALEIVRRFPLLEFYEDVKDAVQDEYINVSIAALAIIKAYNRKEALPTVERALSAPNPMLRIAAASTYLSLSR